MEATTTLADSLLDDLDDLSDLEENQGLENDQESPEHDDDAMKDDGDGPSATSAVTAPRKRKRWLDHTHLQHHLTTITAKSNLSGEEGYNLMTTSNTFLTQVQKELTTLHMDLQEAYHVKFPELAELLPQFHLYKNAIGILQNEDLSDVTIFQEDLHKEANLTSNQIITLSVAGSTTSGQSLTNDQFSHVNALLSDATDLLSVQETLTSFVERHIANLAPNTTTLLGAHLTSRLLTLAGGLANLVQIPACNIQVMGQVSSTSASRAGMSSAGVTTTTMDGSVAGVHEGILVECDLVRKVRGKDKRKALKQLANKTVLVARCDLDHSLRRGTVGGSNDVGKKFRAQLESTFRKWQEPDKAPVVKALPK